MKQFLARSAYTAFRVFDRLGIHVLPKHYYNPIPDHHWLSENKSLWTKRAPIAGVHWNLREQLEWLRQMCNRYYSEVAGLGSYNDIVQSNVGPGFGPIESQVLHCVVRSTKPRRILEIGSGLSTAVMLRAIEKNVSEGDSRTQVTCIEPFPKPALSKLKGINLIKQPSQTVEPSVFQELSSGDLLFIDSSHVLKTGSELASIYLNLLPSLPSGVLVHIHDIWLPYLYSPSTLTHYCDWQETALLLALLTHNSKMSVRTCLSALQVDFPKEAQSILPDFHPRSLKDGLYENTAEQGHYASSIWLQT